MSLKPASLKSYRIEIILFYLLAAGALVAVAFTDLKLDIALNNTSDFISNWFARTGEMPAYCLLLLTSALLSKLLPRPWMRIAAAVACVGCGVYFGLYVARRFFLEDAFRTGCGILYGAGFALVLLLAFRFISVPEPLRKPLICMAVIALAVCAVESGLITLMKEVWGRVRFRDLDGAYSQFTAWYHPNGVNGNRSFPSGHTGSAGMSYLLMLLPFVSDFWRRHRHLAFWLAFCYTTAVAFTRLVMGAHYLSDVTVGGTIAFSCVLIGIKVYESLEAKGKLT